MTRNGKATSSFRIMLRRLYGMGALELKGHFLAICQSRVSPSGRTAEVISGRHESDDELLLRGHFKTPSNASNAVNSPHSARIISENLVLKLPLVI